MFIIYNVNTQAHSQPSETRPASVTDPDIELIVDVSSLDLPQYLTVVTDPTLTPLVRKGAIETDKIRQFVIPVDLIEAIIQDDNGDTDLDEVPDYQGLLAAYLSSDIDDHLAYLASLSENPAIANRTLSQITNLLYSIPTGVAKPEQVSEQFARFISLVPMDQVNIEKMGQLESMLIQYHIPLSVADNLPTQE